MIDHFMEQARKKYAANPHLVPAVRGLLPNIPTPEELAFEERADRALAGYEYYIREAKEQLAKPCVAPAELSPSEQAEKNLSEAWTRGYNLTNRCNVEWMDSNQSLFDDVSGTIDEMQLRGIPIPTDLGFPPSPADLPIDHLDVPHSAKAWIKGSWGFREFKDRDFEAAAQAERSPLARAPKAADHTTGASPSCLPV